MDRYYIYLGLCQFGPRPLAAPLSPSVRGLLSPYAQKSWREGPQSQKCQKLASFWNATPPNAKTTKTVQEPYGILPPRSRSGNGRHERVSHRIDVIVDSNDMPVMRSNCVAKEI